MTRIRVVRIEPRLTALHGERLEVERDRRMDHVVIVDVGQLREIALRGRPNHDAVHG